MTFTDLTVEIPIKNRQKFQKNFPSDRQMVRTVLSVHDRSEPPSGPILGEPAQTGSPRPRSLPRRAHHLASAYQSSLTIHVCFLRETVLVGTNHPNMEETGSLENPIPLGKCYLDLNRA